VASGVHRVFCFVPAHLGRTLAGGTLSIARIGGGDIGVFGVEYRAATNFLLFLARAVGLRADFSECGTVGSRARGVGVFCHFAWPFVLEWSGVVLSAGKARTLALAVVISVGIVLYFYTSVLCGSAEANQVLGGSCGEVGRNKRQVNDF